MAGKTGTSDDENDAWFVGFSNEVTVAVWVGYDNAGGKRRTLGGGATGGHTAVPIFEPIMQAAWAHVAPKTALAPPSPKPSACSRANQSMSNSDRRGSGKRHTTECFRVDGKGKIVDTEYSVLSRERSYASRDSRPAREISAGTSHGRAPGCAPGAALRLLLWLGLVERWLATLPAAQLGWFLEPLVGGSSASDLSLPPDARRCRNRGVENATVRRHRRVRLAESFFAPTFAC